jgi:hypothetical protein
VLPELAEQLGIEVTQLRGWLYARPSWQPSEEGTDRPPRRPVKIVGETVRVPDGVPERRYTVPLRAGVIVRDLTLREVTDVVWSLVSCAMGSMGCSAWRRRRWDATCCAAICACLSSVT